MRLMSLSSVQKIELNVSIGKGVIRIPGVGALLGRWTTSLEFHDRLVKCLQLFESNPTKTPRILKGLKMEVDNQSGFGVLTPFQTTEGRGGD